MSEQELSKGVGASPCPISGEKFAWKADVEKDKASIDSMGNIVIEPYYKVSGKD